MSNYTIKDYYELEPMKYWAVPKGNSFAETILRDPLKYDNYSFTPKMDGEWNKAIIDNGHVAMLARNRNVNKVFADRYERMPHIVEELKSQLPNQTVLLGELAFEDITKTSKDVGSIMRSLPPKARAKQEVGPKLHYYVFDCLMWDGVDLSDLTYEERFINNKHLNFTLKYTHLLSPQPMSELLSYLEKYFADGGEGVVLLDKKSKYAFGKRPARVSVKIKKQLPEFEAKVLSTLEPKKHYEGTEIGSWQYWEETYLPTGETTKCGALHKRSIEYSYTPVTKPYWYGWKNAIRCQYDGRIFDVASGLNDEDRAWLATKDAQELIENGSLYAVVGGMELTPDSVRHPYLVRLRTDM